MSHVICFGEMLWDLLPGGAQPGGAPMNVAYHLQRMGNNVQLISKLGKDELGTKLLDFAAKSKINTDLIQWDTVCATGTVLATPRPDNEMNYEIIKPVAYDFIDASQPAIDAAGRADCFVFGSLAARHPHSRNSLFCLLNVAGTKVFDINLRPPHYSRTLLEELMNACDILKMNEHELELVGGWYSDVTDTEARVKVIAKNFHIQKIIITMRRQGRDLL